MFSFFQEREASVKGGRDGGGDCHRGTGCPRASVQSLFCVCILSKFIFKLSCVLLFVVQKLYWNLRIFFISYLNHLCIFVLSLVTVRSKILGRDTILSVSTPAPELLMATHRVKGGCVTVSGYVIEAALIVLSMQDFDVSLGMYWLGENHALIDCETRIVTLRLPSRDSFTYKGATSKKNSSVIAALKARKMICSGASTYLATVILDSSNE